MSDVVAGIAATPWIVPGLLLVMAVAVLLFRPVAKVLGMPRVMALGLVAALGAILVITITPSAWGNPWSAGGSCDLGIRSPLETAQLLSEFNQRTANVLLFIPLGFCSVFARRPLAAAGLVMCGFALPVGIELVQYSITSLGRSCDSADLLDNTMGMAVGVLLGLTCRIVFTLVDKSARAVWRLAGDSPANEVVGQGGVVTGQTVPNRVAVGRVDAGEVIAMSEYRRRRTEAGMR